MHSEWLGVRRPSGCLPCLNAVCQWLWWELRGSRGGDSLAWLGLSRPPTDGLSLVPRNICFCSNFIRLMLVQLGNCPTVQLVQTMVKVKVKGQVQLPIPHLPSMNFGVGRGGGLVDWPFLNGTLPGPVHCASVSPSALRHSSQKAEGGGGRKGIRSLRELTLCSEYLIHRGSKSHNLAVRSQKA